MIVLIFVACVSTVGGVYGAVSWKAGAKAETHGEDVKLETIKTRVVSVPMISDSEVLGYIVTRLAFTADAAMLKASTVEPEAFVADEAFRAIYEAAPNDMKSARKQLLKTLSSEITSGVNKRLGRDVVKDVLVETWTYLSKQDMAKNNGRSR